ncbi:MAG: toxin-antitoxin system HicB family antitoxin [Tepidisphaeraceae bacterium]
MDYQAKASNVVEIAKGISSKTKSWIEYSHQVFNQKNGVIAKAFRKDDERQAFYGSKEYDQLYAIQMDLMKKHGLSNAVATKSGKFIVRVPKTLHSSLEIEASREGVSLNQLALTKLAVPLEQATSLSPLLIIKAFSEVHDGFAPDRVISDPVLNTRFLRRCRAAGLTQSDYELNHALYDIRKTKSKGTLPPTTKKTEFRDYDDYVFASEIAVRYLQRQEGATLDSILCDPLLQSKFDEITSRLVPGTPVLKLRYGALNLRKTHRLRPQDAAGPEYDLVSVGPVMSVNLDEIPEYPAVYLLYENARPVFAGETDKLRERIDRHLKVSDRRGLPKWLAATEGCDLKYAALPSVTKDERLRWLRQFINREKPVLNYQKVA